MPYTEYQPVSRVETVVTYTATALVCTGPLQGHGPTHAEAQRSLVPQVDLHVLLHYVHREPPCTQFGKVVFTDSPDQRPMGDFD